MRKICHEARNPGLVTHRQKLPPTPSLDGHTSHGQPSRERIRTSRFRDQKMAFWFKSLSRPGLCRDFLQRGIRNPRKTEIFVQACSFQRFRTVGWRKDWFGDGGCYWASGHERGVERGSGCCEIDTKAAAAAGPADSCRFCIGMP